jgi:hypothetical protein
VEPDRPGLSIFHLLPKRAQPYVATVLNSHKLGKWLHKW